MRWRSREEEGPALAAPRSALACWPRPMRSLLVLAFLVMVVSAAVRLVLACPIAVA